MKRSTTIICATRSRRGDATSLPESESSRAQKGLVLRASHYREITPARPQLACVLCLHQCQSYTRTMLTDASTISKGVDFFAHVRNCTHLFLDQRQVAFFFTAKLTHRFLQFNCLIQQVLSTDNVSMNKYSSMRTKTQLHLQTWPFAPCTNLLSILLQYSFVACNSSASRLFSALIAEACTATHSSAIKLFSTILA